ncbi:MAG: hypothetical protein DHS20C01_15050 [marine bacterium B5-7]|nr:MAG: hypothetical protein DHS20C01_15050 [marine bacterium B5-7]
MNQRTLEKVIQSIPTSDGAGVSLRRSIGSSDADRHDPFLMLDEFFSDDPNDYIAGFPSHPHRGFETVTYMLDGCMRHEDNVGNAGNLGPGDVQWMTAAGGIIHSEMPQQREGRMRGFQLWINLPASDKMKPAKYRDILAQDIPTAALDGGGQARVIAGSLTQGNVVTHGPIPDKNSESMVAPLYLDIHLPPITQANIPIDEGHNAFTYLYEGDVVMGEDRRMLNRYSAGILSGGDTVCIQSGEKAARLLLIAGKPLGEPVVQYGPFVMNTPQEIERAIEDYRQNRLFGTA